MAVIIPQVITEDRASGAQVIDGSLRFDGTSQYLQRTFTSAGNRKKNTVSFWVKRSSFGDSYQRIFNCDTGTQSLHEIVFNNEPSPNQDNLVSEVYISSQSRIRTNAVLRDTGWYHVVVVYDSLNSTQADRQIIYINGERQSINNSVSVGNIDGMFSSANEHRIGNGRSYAVPFNGSLSNFYFIDGQALGPEYFGFTDPLTNTWRPKKYTETFVQSTTLYSGGTSLTWDNDPIGSKWTLSNSNKTATITSGTSTYTGGNIWTTSINSNTTYAWTLNVSNGDSTGGWYFTDSQSATSTHPDQLSGNTLGLRGGETSAGTYGTFATANGTNSDQAQISLSSSVSPNGTKKIHFVVYRPSSGNGKVWVRGDADSSWIGGGDPSNTSSTPSFYIPDGATYFASIDYTGSTSTSLTLDGDGSIIQTSGENSFYLPFDGSAPIGEDKSGNGNNWTPVNFGGSNTLEKATGALPILNTDGGGKVARAGVFGSEVGAYYAVTVPGGIGGGYYLDGTQKPTLSLIRGATYTFDQSDSSNSSHPLVFGTTADGNDYSDGVTTNGTPGSAGAYTKITVPHNAPDTLYYHCSAHGGMGSSTTQTTDTKKADPYAWKNVLALPLVSSSADVSNQINSGSTTKTITANGDVSASSAQSNFYGGSYYFDGTGDYLQTPDSTDFTMGSGDYTIEGWFYFNNLSATQRLFGQRASGGSPHQFLTETSSSGVIYYYFTIGGTIYQVTGNTLSTSQWNHIAIVRSGDIHTIYTNGVAVGLRTQSGSLEDRAEPFSIGRQGDYTSDAFNGYIQDFRIYKGVAKYTSNFIPASTNPDILPDTPSGVSGGSKLAKITDGAVSFDGTNDYLEVGDSVDFTFGSDDWTMECFVYPITPGSNSYQSLIHKYNGSDASGSSWFWSLYSYTDGSSSMNFYFYSGSSQYAYTTASKVVRQNTWNHVAVTRDGNTVRLYVNGVQDGTINVTGYTMNDSSTSVRFGTDGAGAYDLTGFISNARIIKGTCLYTSGTTFTPPSAPLTDVTNTKLLCCQSNTSATAAAVSPGSITANGNASATNFNPFTTDINAVRGQETGYATLNPLNNTSCTLSEGNLKFVTAGNNSVIWATQPIPTYGKWYFESTFGGGDMALMLDQKASRTPTDVNLTTTGIAMYMYYSTGSTSNRFQTNSTNTAFNSSFTGDTVGDVYGFEVDMDAGTIRVRKQDGSDSGLFTMPDALKSAPLFPGFSVIATWPVVTQTLNFGQKPFRMPPRDGFQPLNAANARPSTVIARPDQYVGVTTYSGNNTGQTINLGFQPDFVWIKPRSAINNALFDSVRGATKRLISNLTNSEDTISAVTAFNRDGFTLGGDYNSSGTNYVAWSWKAGGNSNTFNIDDVGYDTASAAGLTGGGYAVTGASVNTKSGFSIIQWEHDGTPGGHSMPHGLGRTPKFIITRNIDITSNWGSYHYNYDNGAGTSGINFNSTGAAGSNVGWWNNTGPTSSQFSLGTFFDDAGTFIAYLWAEIPGFSKFGSFTGNNSTDGPVIITGFRPKYVLIKCSSSEQSGNAHWVLFDSERIKYNPTSTVISVNLADRDYTSADGVVGIDILSNGFKLRDDNTSRNASATYVYAAFAEAPTFNLYGGQANAR